MPLSTSFLARQDHRKANHNLAFSSGLPVILSCKETGAERHRSSLPYESASVQGLEWALEPPLRSLFSTRLNTWNCATQLIERSASVRSRRNGSSTDDQDSPLEPKIVAGAAELVENGPRPSVSSAKGLVALPQAFLHVCCELCKVLSELL